MRLVLRGEHRNLQRPRRASSFKTDVERIYRIGAIVRVLERLVEDGFRNGSGRSLDQLPSSLRILMEEVAMRFMVTVPAS